MKFLAKINRNYLLLFGAILLVLSVSGYFILKTILLQNTKLNLLTRESLIEKQIAATGEIPDLKPLIEVYRVDSLKPTALSFSEIPLFNEAENETELYAELSGIIIIKGKNYQVKLREASVENEDLATSIAVSFSALMLAAFAISYFITQRLNKTTWRIFEENLLAIENFDFRKDAPLLLQPSGIDEFDRLNAVVNSLTTRLKNDYLTLKQFTENAAHEIRTPLTIASLKLEEILQQDLPEELFAKTVEAINAIRQLSLLNQNLLLLVKIENKQFVETEKLDLNALIKKKIDEFEPLLQEHNCHVDFRPESGFVVEMNQYLAGILLNNLFSNALNHNVANGYITIRTNQDEFVICNSGQPEVLDEKTIFNRFVKGKSSSHGLGLAIVKQICDSHHLQVTYSYSGKHCFTITHAK